LQAEKAPLYRAILNVFVAERARFRHFAPAGRGAAGARDRFT
jgi:hypothetical protein